MQEQNDKKWVMVQLSTQGEKCDSWKSMLRELRKLLGQQVEAHFLGVWLHDEFWDRAEYLPGYILVEHHPESTYASVKDMNSQNLKFFKGVVEVDSSGKPEFLTDKKVQGMLKKSRDTLIPKIESGTYLKVQRGEWKKSRVYVCAVCDDLIVCNVRTHERRRSLVLPIESFAKGEDSDGNG